MHELMDAKYSVNSANPFLLTIKSTPWAAVHYTTQSESVQYGTSSKFDIAPVGDLVCFQALLLIFIGLGVSVDGTNNATPYPVISSLECPLAARDAASIDAAYGTDGYSTFLTEEYGAAPSEEAIPDPADVCETATGPQVLYIANVGLHAAHQTNLIIGGHTIDSRTDYTIAMIQELNGDVNRDHYGMWGNASTLLESLVQSMTTRYCYVQADFSFHSDIGLSFALCAALFSKMQVEYSFRSRKEMVLVTQLNARPLNGSTQAPLSDTDLCAGMDVHYIVLEQSMRDAFTEASFEQVLVRVHEQSKSAKSTSIHLELQGSGYILGLMMMATREAAIHLNLYDNFEGVNGRAAIKTINVHFDGSTIYEGESERLHLLYPGFYTPRKPCLFVYVLAFTPSVFALQVICGVNINLIDDAKVVVTLQPVLSTENVTLFVVMLEMTFLSYEAGHVRAFLS